METRARSVLIVILFLLVLITRLYSAYYLPELFRDEEALIEQAKSINEFGRSVEGVYHPFYVVVRSGIGTYLFVYPLALICKITGYSISGIRICLQILTIIAAFNIAIGVWIYTKNKKLGLYTYFVLLMLPWGFVQANRIWDPTLVPFYFSIFFLCYCLYIKHDFKNKIRGELCLIIAEGDLVLLAIVYPPCRIPAVAIWIFSICHLITIRKLKLKTFIVIVCICCILSVPMVYNMIFNSEFFNARTEKLFIFNGENNANAIFTFLKNIFENFNPTYLFITGDVIDRHSLPIWGTLGTISLIPMIVEIRKNKVGFIEKLSWFCILMSTLSVSLTNEYQPHTLRNCLCWPAFAILIANGWYAFLEDKAVYKCNICICLVIFQYILVFISYIMYYEGRLWFILS